MRQNWTVYLEDVYLQHFVDIERQRDPWLLSPLARSSSSSRLVSSHLIKSNNLWWSGLDLPPSLAVSDPKRYRSLFPSEQCYLCTITVCNSTISLWETISLFNQFDHISVHIYLLPVQLVCRLCFLCFYFKRKDKYEWDWWPKYDIWY